MMKRVLQNYKKKKKKKKDLLPLMNGEALEFQQKMNSISFLTN
jgi:hypothetical protein